MGDIQNYIYCYTGKRVIELLVISNSNRDMARMSFMKGFWINDNCRN